LTKLERKLGEVLGLAMAAQGATRKVKSRKNLQPAKQEKEQTMNEQQQDAEWSVAEWHGKLLIDRNGENIGKATRRLRRR
jgi:hypothetical protein